VCLGEAAKEISRKQGLRPAMECGDLLKSLNLLGRPDGLHRAEKASIVRASGRHVLAMSDLGLAKSPVGPGAGAGREGPGAGAGREVGPGATSSCLASLWARSPTSGAVRAVM